MPPESDIDVHGVRRCRPRDLFFAERTCENSMTFPSDIAIRTVLDELHSAADGDRERWQARTGSTDAAQNARGGGDLVRLGEFYLAASPEAGRLLYMLGRSSKAQTMVEFGASFGVSTLYLGAAAKENGGHLITTEVHPEKCAALRKNLDRTSLADHVTLLIGDARQTLANVDGPVDLLYLDGWKSAYLPVYQLMRPKLAPGCLILADNYAHEAAKPYLDAIQATESGCVTVLMDDLAISCVVA